MPLIAALLIGLLLYKKQRRTMTASEYNEMMASDYVIVGTDVVRMIDVAPF